MDRISVKAANTLAQMQADHNMEIANIKAGYRNIRYEASFSTTFNKLRVTVSGYDILWLVELILGSKLEPQYVREANIVYKTIRGLQMYPSETALCCVKDGMVLMDADTLNNLAKYGAMVLRYASWHIDIANRKMLEDLYVDCFSE